MKLCCRSVSRLWRCWSGLSSPSASFTSWESAPEPEEEPAPIQQFGVQSDHGGEIAETRSRATRKLLRDFGSSNSVKRVAEEHLLTGIINYRTSLILLCDCVCVFCVGVAFTAALVSFGSYVSSGKHPGLVRVVDNVLNNAGSAAWIANSRQTQYH